MVGRACAEMISGRVGSTKGRTRIFAGLIKSQPSGHATLGQGAERRPRARIMAPPRSGLAESLGGRRAAPSVQRIPQVTPGIGSRSDPFDRPRLRTCASSHSEGPSSPDTMNPSCPGRRVRVPAPPRRLRRSRQEQSAGCGARWASSSPTSARGRTRRGTDVARPRPTRRARRLNRLPSRRRPRPDPDPVPWRDTSPSRQRG